MTRDTYPDDAALDQATRAMLRYAPDQADMLSWAAAHGYELAVQGYRLDQEEEQGGT